MICHFGEPLSTFLLKSLFSEICCIVLSLETALELQKADFVLCLTSVASRLLRIEPDL